MLTKDYLNIWLETFVQPFRAANTVACYRRAIAHLPAALLSTQLDELNGIQIQQALNEQARTAPRAAQLTYATMHCAMERAVLLGMLDRNPVKGCIKPPHQTATAPVLTLAQMRLYLQAIRAVDSYVLLLLMASLGLRRGEALGLMWADLDQQTIHVQRQRMRIGGSYQTCALKSRQSNRVLPVPESTWRCLLAERARANSLFICDVTPSKLRNDHMKALRMANLPQNVTLHGLRHSMATIAAGQGTPIKLLQAILGHAKYDLTADLYAAHIDESSTLLPIAGYADAVGL